MLRPPDLDTDRGQLVWDTLNAAASGDVPALRSLLEQDRELAHEYSPLDFAVREGHLEAVQLLLAAGAPLAWATRRGHASIVLMLQRAGATR